MDRSLYLEVKDWDRVGRNELIGCMSIPVKDIVESKSMDSWFKLLEAEVGKSKYFKIIVEEDVSEELKEEQRAFDKRIGTTIRRRKKIVSTASDQLPKMKLSDFNLLVVLGKGSFGKVKIVPCKCVPWY